MFYETFVHGQSPLHRLDARVKILVATAFSIVIALCSRWSALIPGLGFSLLLVCLARPSLRNLALRLLLVNALILFLWLFLPFTFDGHAFLTIGPLRATEEGVLYATLLTLRSNTIILALISLLSTTPVSTLGKAMRKLGVPDKIIQLFFFTYRYIHVIHLEYERLIRALQVRGFRPGTNFHTYKTYAYLVGMLVVRSYDRSERVRKAMVCRGFKGRFYDLSEFSLRKADWSALILMLMIIVAIALIEWTRIIP